MQRAHARYREVLQTQNGLSTSARLVYCYLISRADWDTGQAYVKQETVAEELGMGRTTVSGALRELRDGEWLIWERTTPTLVTYTLKPHDAVNDPWKGEPVKPLPRKRRAPRRTKAESIYEAHDVQNPNTVGTGRPAESEHRGAERPAESEHREEDRPAESEHRDRQNPNIVGSHDRQNPNIRPAESEHPYRTTIKEPRSRNHSH